MKTDVVVLAGGGGPRMGGGEALRMLAGATMIQRAVRQAAQWSDMVAVSVREGGQAGEFAAPEIVDKEGEGPLAGLAAALRFADAAGLDAVLTIPCDMPLLPPNLLDGLELALTTDLGAAIASSGGALYPVCGLWRAESLERLPAYRASGRSSLKGFAAQIGFAAVEWPVESYDPFLNINRPEELAAAERLLATLRSR